MPKTLTLPESFFNEAYDSIMDMNELVKMLHEHVLLETRYGDQKIPPGHDIVLDTISDMLSGMMDDFDLSALYRREKKAEIREDSHE